MHLLYNHSLHSYSICAPLGHVDGEKLLSNYNVRVHAVNGAFKHLPYNVKLSLSITFCRSMYGSGLVNMSDAYQERLDVTWRKSVRLLLSVPYRAHGRVLPLLCGDFGIRETIFNQILNFFRKLSNCKESQYRVVFNNIYVGSQSCVSENLRYLCQCFGCDMPLLLTRDKCYIRNFFLRRANFNETVYNLAEFAKCILEARDLLNEFLTKQQCNDILWDILIL